jgi:hypothetical protein
VRPGTKRVSVEVTQNDIDRGRRNATGCPLARAIRRVTPVRPIAVFGGDDGYEAGGVRYPLDMDARLFIGLFDGRQDSVRWLPSLTFEIEVPA